jgi:hypothetical protein
LFLLCCSSARCRHTFDRRHCGLVCHFKTDPTETVGLCFGYPKTPCLRAEGKLSSKQMNRPFVCWIRWLGITNKQYIWDFLLLQDFQCFNLYYYSVGCSARSLRSNHVPHRRCGRLYLDYKICCHQGEEQVCNECSFMMRGEIWTHSAQLVKLFSKKGYQTENCLPVLPDAHF